MKRKCSANQAAIGKTERERNTAAMENICLANQAAGEKTVQEKCSPGDAE